MKQLAGNFLLHPHNKAAILAALLCMTVRAGRVELPLSDWQPDVLPLNYARSHIFSTQFFWNE